MHHEGGGGDNFNVNVEIKQPTATAITGHHHSVKAKQLVSIDPKQDKDTTRITVENIDSKEYVLVFKNPKTLKNTNSAAIKTDASAS